LDLSSLVRDLLDLTRIESGQKKREMARVNLSEVVRAALDTITPEATEHHIAVDMVCPPDVTLWADRNEIEIVLNNLVSNAIKYNKQNGQVTIRVTPGDHEVEIAVLDTGIDLSKEEVVRLFESFVRIRVTIQVGGMDKADVAGFDVESHS